MKIRVFVSYSHQDTSYKDLILKHLKGLESEGVEFWSDEVIVAGDKWDKKIKGSIKEADIALVLVSQQFLDSAYCTNVEISRFLNRCRKSGLVIFPIILSACEWERHEWLRSRQFLPGGDKTIEEHYSKPGTQKRLLHDIRQDLRKQIDQIRQSREKPSENLGADRASAKSQGDNFSEDVSQMLTPELQPIPFKNVAITADLDYSAVTEHAYHNIQKIAPAWSPGHFIWPGIAPEEVVSAFGVRNKERIKDKSKGVNEETADNPLVRLIANPIATRDTIHLIVAPISWDMYSVTKRYPEQDPSDLLGRYEPSPQLLRTIKRFQEKFPTSHPGDSKSRRPLVGPRDFVPLGLEGLVVTSDDRAFLRLKDITTTVGGLNWDVSFSGYARFDTTYCVNSPVEEDMRFISLNLDRWVAKEFHREIGIEIGNIENSVVLGVHRNTISGAIDIIVFCQVTLHSRTIADALYIKARLREEKRHAEVSGSHWSYEQRRKELLAGFDCTGDVPGSLGADEREVWQSRGKFIPFTQVEIEKFLTSGIAGLRQKLLPEAKRVLLGALHDRK